MMDRVGAKLCVRPTPSSPEGIAAFLDVASTWHPGQLLRSKLSDTAFFLSPDWLRRVRSRTSKPKSASPVEIVAECWLKCRAHALDRGLKRRSGLHPDLNPGHPIAELALCFQLWQQYSNERKHRGDALRPILVDLYGTLDKAAVAFDATDNQPAPDLDPELTSTLRSQFARPANLPWFPEKPDWALESVDIDQEEPWRAWWLLDPATHPYNE
ncbi:hypothetical protein ON010_g13398 [Phytophthora cinnamomi]|nr:hypothetical protein ON010_g13398 [Phytophthora cinnamomi]